MVQISPKGGDIAGNVTVLLVGTAFEDFGDAKCKFGAATVRATVHHTGAITCTAPHADETMIFPTLSRPPVPRQPHFSAQQGHYPIEMPVMVSLNGVDFKASQFVTFSYYDLGRVLLAAVRPSGGPPSGGTLVNLSGTFFRDYGGGVQGPRCRFGSVVVPATLLSFTQAQCLSPPHPAGDAERVPVSLSLNGYTDERGLAGGQLGLG